MAVDVKVATVGLADNASLWEIGKDKGVTRFRFLTHPELVNEVCLRCLFYHDTVWDIDDPSAPEPPLHPLCACTREPEWTEDTVLGQDPDGNPIVSDPAPELKPGQFLQTALAKLPAEKMDAMIGPTRGKLLRAGLLEPRDLVSHKRGIRPVKRLLKTTGLKPGEIQQLSYQELRELSIERMGERARRPMRPVRGARVGQEPPLNPALFVQRSKRKK